MYLTIKTVARLTLPPNKADHIFWDDELTGFGYRLWRYRERARSCWVIQYRNRNGRKRRMTIAPGLLPAHAARRLAAEQLAKVRIGGDPQGEKATNRLRGSRSFHRMVEDFIAARGPKWRPNTAHQYRYTLLVCWQPLHKMDIDTVTRADIAVVLRRMEQERGTAAAALARTTLGTLYIWAMGQGLIEANPVIGTAKVEYSGKRERVLSDEEIAKVWQACSAPDNFPNGGNFGRVLKLLILLGARRREIECMKWSELDLTKAIWTLPAERSKNRRALTLPLSPAALAIFAEILPQRSEAYLFSRFGNIDGGRQLKKLREQAGVHDWSPHDLRRTCATGMANLGIAPHVIECVLNHVSGFRRGVAGVYNRSSYAREVADALLRWSEHVTGVAGAPTSNVVTLRA
jgi:integrase